MHRHTFNLECALRLKAYRLSLKITQAQMADLLNMSLSGYCHWEQGKKALDLSDCALIAGALDLPPAYVAIKLLPPINGSKEMTLVMDLLRENE